jgi:hypothetical protein
MYQHLVRIDSPGKFQGQHVLQYKNEYDVYSKFKPAQSMVAKGCASLEPSDTK